jgi:hypothetical protein
VSAGTAAAVMWAANFAATAWYLHAYAGVGDAPWRLFQALILVTGLVFSLIGRNWAAAGFCAATLIILGRDWWNRRGRKVAKLIGEKSRALIAGLVEKLRGELEPAPEGARA